MTMKVFSALLIGMTIYGLQSLLWWGLVDAMADSKRGARPSPYTKHALSDLQRITVFEALSCAGKTPTFTTRVFVVSICPSIPRASANITTRPLLRAQNKYGAWLKSTKLMALTNNGVREWRG
mmetsp:Transcript_32453/g.100424  ORF Transcript_32453/g.100424 Transcript_32453/m.100424 type:complete len:123 (-) Transcript_32453:783-1151(-)